MALGPPTSTTLRHLINHPRHSHRFSDLFCPHSHPWLTRALPWWVAKKSHLFSSIICWGTYWGPRERWELKDRELEERELFHWRRDPRLTLVYSILLCIDLVGWLCLDGMIPVCGWLWSMKWNIIHVYIGTNWKINCKKERKYIHLGRTSATWGDIKKVYDME